MSFEVVTHDIQISVFDSILVESTKVTGFNRVLCPVERERERERESIFQFSSIFTVRRYIYEYRPNTRIHRFYERSSMEQWLKFISQLSKWSYILTNIKVEVMNQTFY